ncbi:ABC transporter ATP-binding protein [Rhodococcus sp. HNM0569]|uniref:ABC transporter ATP-binding protein n=1 Tax=Rhodococcus sp. HNM0569 TaxID=2716340 RepID=UPI00146CB4EE|nr:ABC transporter ATP-binding protein [Rhodococcus sp. HNM0569]NLU83949.1 ABC transporter ATP-binding protein [Rhodococcus sp. HNM0569]
MTSASTDGPSAPPHDVIDVRGLTKRFGSSTALSGLDLSVRAGTVHGFAGPNGSGKSTTMQILLGLVRRDGGTATLLGCDPWTDAAALHQRVAAVPEDPAVRADLTAGETVDLLSRLRGRLDPARRRGLLDRFELDPTRRGRNLSKGERQKVALVAAFAAQVDVLLLDEPTSDLDPVMEDVFRSCVAEFAARGGTVLLSSHRLDEVDALCDAVTVIRDGRTVLSGAVADLRRTTRTTLTVTTRIRPKPISTAPGVHDVRPGPDDHTMSFSVEPDHLDAVMTTLSGLGLVRIAAHPPTLDDLFLQLYRAPGEPAPALRAYEESRS